MRREGATGMCVTQLKVERSRVGERNYYPAAVTKARRGTARHGTAEGSNL